MDQLHKRFTSDQVRAILQGYCVGALDRSSVEEVLGISKTRFFAVLKQYRADSEGFGVDYARSAKPRLSEAAEDAIKTELLRDKALVEDESLPITTYNYSHIKDRLKEHDLKVSLPTIINRAKALDCYQRPAKHKTHDREVLTTAVGALIQHDASHHRWSPYASEKWTLITSLDDFSRKMLYADFVEQETTWSHIKAAEALVCGYGLPLRYYVDSLRVFRFVQAAIAFGESMYSKLTRQSHNGDG